MAKRSLTIAGHRTSISLEPEFWDALREIAQERGTSVAALAAEVDRTRSEGNNLSAALRLLALEHYRSRDRRVS